MNVTGACRDHRGRGHRHRENQIPRRTPPQGLVHDRDVGERGPLRGDGTGHVWGDMNVLESSEVIRDGR